MDLIEKINSDYKSALKNKESLSVSVLRLLRSNIHNQEIIKKRKKLTDEEIIKVLKSEIKRRHDSIEAFKRGQRVDLAEKEEKELDILLQYLPKQLSKEEIKTFVLKKLAGKERREVNFGSIMGEVMREFGGQADGKIVSEVVREYISQK